MMHEELEAIRLRACGPPEDRGYDVPSLLGYIDELHNIVQDLRQEPGWELGRREERREVLALLTDRRGYHDEENNSEAADALADVHFDIARRGPVAPHLAPDDLRRENEALRAALRDLFAAWDAWDGDIHQWDRVRAVKHAFAVARRLIEEVV